MQGLESVACGMGLEVQRQMVASIDRETPI